MSGGKNSVTFSMDTSGLMQWLNELEAEAQAAVRPAAQAGAQVLYDEVKRNVAAIGRKSGNLANSIYQAFSKDESGQGLATYHVSWRTGREKDENGRRISGGKPRAPHGHLLEYGYLMRYEYSQDEQGHVRPMVRPEMRGKPKPKSGSKNRAALDAYYVPKKGGPVQVAARPFVRPAMAKFPQALEAAKAELFKRLDQKLR